jgi:hypothetical protein
MANDKREDWSTRRRDLPRSGRGNRTWRSRIQRESRVLPLPGRQTSDSRPDELPNLI